ncbi:hypothetical protein [Hymenobacter fodinae]|uniref:Uncharacterized protein n=1 Tax=Hymenobacter fodinae TaxID=2510796 RepID=A0A4Z0P3B0_9BACT|nr:hypothetical protein [Hymenobacter fodinae]TGE05609.1 hypothetical protein EU556_20115 [Hymenobacter fodinae]
MITVLIEEGPGALNACWLDSEAGFKLKVVPEGLILKFRSEPEGQKIELHIHPSMVYMLNDFLKAQPHGTFMPKEGKEERLAEMAAFDKEYDEKHGNNLPNNLAPPF